MKNKTVLLGSIIAGVLALAPGAASAAQGLGACTLDGNASLTPGLTSNTPTPSPTVPSPDWAVPQEVDWGGTHFDYSFSGALANCHGGTPSGPGGPASGTIFAGTKIKAAGETWDWPATLATPSGNGGCTGSHTTGTSVVVWDDGKVSVIDYATDGAAAAIQLMGQIRGTGITLSRPGPVVNGVPTTITMAFAPEFGGDEVAGPLAFHPTDPQDCAGSGVSSAPITGVIGHGNYQ